MTLFEKLKNRTGYTETDPRVTIPEALSRAEELGVAGAEINMNFRSHFPERYDENMKNEIRNAVEESGTELSFHGPVDISLISRHKPIQEAAARRMSAFIETAIALGGKRFTFHPGQAAFMRPSEKEVVFYRRKHPQYLTDAFLASLTEIAKTAYRRVELIMEITHPLDKPVMDIISKFAREGLLAFAYDTAHYNSYEFIDGNLEYIKCCHLNDRKGKKAHIPLGNGDVDLKGAIEKIIGSDCFFIIESGRFEWVRQSIDFLKSLE
ncbi:MAG: TIM barrel protein [candidate division Zixibacteria bacterium]|nr:TIM barrel protein [candidate division Zixibacteria bacterium]